MASNDRQIAVGIAGLGRSGWDIHARLLKEIPDKYRVVAVSDEIAERRAEAVAAFGCRAYETFDGLVGDPQVELLVVAVPSFLHAEYTIAALNAGKAVVCEKPMATSLAAADAMIRCAADTGRPLTVFQNKRYSADFQAVKRVIDSGVLGRIVLIRIAYHAFKRRWDWQTLKEFGGGSLNNTCPHPIDQALVLLGGRTPAVACERDRILSLGDADDHVRIGLRADGAPTVEIEVTDAVAYPQPHWLVVGTLGGLSGSTRKLEWKYVKPEEFPPCSLDPRPTSDRGYNREELVWHQDAWSSDEDRSPGEVGFYLDLHDSLTNGAPLAVDPRVVRTQMAIIAECQRQAPV